MRRMGRAGRRAVCFHVASSAPRSRQELPQSRPVSIGVSPHNCVSRPAWQRTTSGDKPGKVKGRLLACVSRMVSRSRSSRFPLTCTGLVSSSSCDSAIYGTPTIYSKIGCIRACPLYGHSSSNSGPMTRLSSSFRQCAPVGPAVFRNPRRRMEGLDPPQAGQGRLVLIEILSQPLSQP
jgi:hypothetical protein